MKLPNVGSVPRGVLRPKAPSLYEQRFAVCRDCPEYKAASAQCAKCLCPLAAKLTIKDATCPIGKW